MSDLREELIQVAAVAVSIIEDLDYGMADSSVMQPFPGPGGSAFQGQSRFIVNEILEERHRQDAKWGPMHHPIDHWLTILMEEVGEAAKAAIGDDDESKRQPRIRATAKRGSR